MSRWTAQSTRRGPLKTVVFAAALAFVCAAATAFASPATSAQPKCPPDHDIGEERHPTLGLAAHYCERDGVRNGPYWVRRFGGGLRLHELFVAGKRHGPALAWHADGTPASNGRYHDGKPDGTWRQFSERGALIAEFTLRHGTGTWMRAWDSGRFKERGPLVNGERHGTWVFWRASGKLDRIGDYVRGDRHGVWHFFSREGRVNGTNVFDRGSGLAVRWHDNGQPRSRGWLRHEKREGTWTWWHNNGQLSLRATFRGGHMNGVVVGWHRNGTRASRQVFADGREHGTEQRWNASGRLVVQRAWQRGQPHGRALYFDMAGVLRAVSCFDAGRITRHLRDVDLAPDTRTRKRLLNRLRLHPLKAAMLSHAGRQVRCGVEQSAVASRPPANKTSGGPERRPDHRADQAVELIKR